MARSNPELIAAFRNTISKLKKGAPYQWGHMGACNCGNLAQELISLSKEEIHRYAMSKSGDWNEQLNDYCPTSGYPMDLMIGKLVEKGLSIEELKHLEKLSDPKILANIPLPRRNQLTKNNIHDLIFYLETWLELLENQWLESNSHLSIDTKKKNIPVQVFA
ncbi:hypothetical protein SAMN00777080_4132 [Aquiflexum balticum DSM 16537]|uniref:Uncharacterized protein n=1 Tax=Aquiflexum balticum DSM 16537 TaxID=758820 RepID=A0A1W2H9C6_9BACT|nr:hypothetical protein [Aquiflexum balticum]SMD45480.1 hypothetical protein SAMN00777080_4132 [Aquiflexum balticum DSM 16537]